MTSVYADAHKLAEAGYAVLPTSKTKAALTEHGVYDATCDHSQIERWAKKHPKANLAVACGEQSGNLVAADIDNISAASVNGRLRLPSAPMVKTPNGGYHLWCSSTRPFRTVHTAWGELRGNNSYVMVPPSQLGSGDLYEWAISLEMEKLLPLEALSGFLPNVEKDLEEGFDCKRAGAGRSEPKDYAQSLGPALATRDWKAVATSPELAARFREIYSLPSAGKHFRCLLPTCTDSSTPHAALWDSPQGFKYRCFSREYMGETRGIAMSLPAVHAAVATGRMELTEVELVYWTKRFVVEAGLASKPSVDLPELPQGLPPRVYEARDAIQSVYEVWSVGDDDLRPRPLSNAFLASTSGMSKSSVCRAKGDLIRRKIIVPAGTYKTAYGKPGTLWLPGGNDCPTTRTSTHPTKIPVPPEHAGRD